MVKIGQSKKYPLNFSASRVALVTTSLKSGRFWTTFSLGGGVIVFWGQGWWFGGGCSYVKVLWGLWKRALWGEGGALLDHLSFGGGGGLGGCYD